MNKADGKFYGAIIGKSDPFQDKGYPLDLKEQVFFWKNENYVEITKKETTEAVASIFYIPEYDEYCLEPFQSLSCFLASGQPLGKERCYYLPRGTEIYILDKSNHFELG